MTNLAVTRNKIPAMSDKAIDKVREVEKISLSMPQISIGTSHILHAGMYSRTVFIPAGTMITGVLIKIATLLIISGDVIAYIGGETIYLSGYNVLPASAHRKQAFLAQTDVYMTMIFPTDVSSVKEAENEFTDEALMLVSNNGANNEIIITGE